MNIVEKNGYGSICDNEFDKKYIQGRVSFVIYSIDSEEAIWLFDLLKHPIDFWTKHIRWNRFFKTIN